MTSSIRLTILDGGKTPVHSGEYTKRVDIGRQDRGEAGPYSVTEEADRWRLVIAPLTEDTVSRNHLSIVPLADGRFRITNGSKAIPIRLSSGVEVRPGESRDLPVPAQLMLGRKMIRIGSPDEDAGGPRELAEKTLAPGAGFDVMTTRMGGRSLPLSGGDKETIRWLKAVMDVLQASASSPDFFEKAAMAAAEMVGLDSAGVWLIRDGEWAEQTTAPRLEPGSKPRPGASRSLLDLVRDRGKTRWYTPGQAPIDSGSLAMLSAVIAAPILNREGQVIGALYGDRSLAGALSRSLGDITEVQAMLVELLAEGIAAGLDRLRREQEMLAARVRFEQFFTPDLARQLERNPDLLKGRESEVTLLFCDIRGFSRISEKLGPAKTVEWINDVMGHMSDSVIAHHGVLVDYIGDELMAMWGAPSDQPDHAALACRAALEILAKLPGLGAAWEPTLGEPLGLGIGLNTGKARVGNTGTARKFKYGPLGNAVNLASRVQGATKHFQARLLITGATRDAIGEGFATRRLGKVRVVNIAEPVDLHELASGESRDWATLKESYEAALACFEAGDLRPAIRILGNLQIDHPADGPSLLLLARVVNALCEPESFDPVWTLGTK